MKLIRSMVTAMAGYTPGEQPRIQGLIKLNTNENPYPPSPRVGAALRQFGVSGLRRYPDPLCLALRRRIAQLHKCRLEEVFVGNGSDEILALCTKAFVEDCGTIGYFEPSYSLYPVLAAIRAVATRPVELAPDFGWRMPPRYRASLFFMTTPNAPTGVQYPPAVVGRFCRTFPGVVLIDEAYVDFAPVDCMALAKKMGNVLVLRTLSKSFALAGLRVGYVVGHKALIAAMFKLKDSYNVDMLAQRLALAALADIKHMRRTAARIARNRARLARGLSRLGCAVAVSAANFLWVNPGAISAAAYFAALRRRKILVRYFPGPRTGTHVRITVGTGRECDALIGATAAILRRGR